MNKLLKLIILLNKLIWTIWKKNYSDGSKQSSGKVGSATFVDDISSKFSWRIKSQHRIVTAELFVIYQGVVFAKTPNRSKYSYIFRLNFCFNNY